MKSSFLGKEKIKKGLNCETSCFGMNWRWFGNFWVENELGTSGLRMVMKACKLRVWKKLGAIHFWTMPVTGRERHSRVIQIPPLGGQRGGEGDVSFFSRPFFSEQFKTLFLLYFLFLVVTLFVTLFILCYNFCNSCELGKAGVPRTWELVSF